MFETLKRIYKKTQDQTYLTNAVSRGWITEEQKEEIIASVE